MNDKYIKPITAIVCCLIIGGSLLMYQSNKNKNFREKQELEYKHKVEAEKIKRIERETKLIDYNFCIEDANQAKLDYAELNGTVKDEIITASGYIWKEANKIKDDAIKICDKKYL